MSDVVDAVPVQPVPQPPPVVEDTGGALTATQAANILAQRRWGKDESTGEDAPAPAVERAPPPVSTQEVEVAPEEGTSDQTKETEPEAPAIDPPKSWSKEARERWATLDPDTQQYLQARDSEDSAAVKRALNEAAEKAKTYESKAQAADQERQKYEAALPLLLQQQVEQFAIEFPDIKTPADIERTIKEDPARALLIQYKLQTMQATQSRLGEAQTRQTQAKREQFATFAKEQDDLFNKAVTASELKELRDNAEKFMTDAGFSQDELGNAWVGEKEISIRDHRMQNIIRKAMLYDKVKETSVKKDIQLKAKPVPPVQRPGAARPERASEAQRISQLNAELGKQGIPQRRQIEIAAELMTLHGAPKG